MILRVKERGEGAPGSFLGGASALWLRQRRLASKRNRRTLRGPQPCVRAPDWRRWAGRFDGFGEVGAGRFDGFGGEGGVWWLRGMVLREGG